MVLDPPAYRPTDDPSDLMWYFQRRPKRMSKAHSISTHAHLLHIHDIRGDESLHLSEQIRQILPDSELILIALDPTLLAQGDMAIRFRSLPFHETEQVDISSLIAPQGSTDLHTPLPAEYSQTEYVQYVNGVLTFLEQHKNANRRVALCLMKKDQWLRDASPWDYLQMAFGKTMFDCIQSHRRQFVIEAFAVSSAGILHTPLGQANYNPYTAAIDDPYQWEPLGVEAPFFWFFQLLEKRALRPTNRIDRFLFQEQRLRIYMPYILR